MLSSSASALAGRAYACAPSQSAAGCSNNSSASGAGSVMVHSRGSSIQEAPATQSQAQAPSVSEIEPCPAKATNSHANSSELSIVQVTNLASSAVAGGAVQGEQKGWQHAEETRSSPAHHRPNTNVAAAVPASSPFPLKLAEVTEADRLEKRSQANAQLPQSAVVSRVLGRLGSSVLDRPAQVWRPPQCY